MAKLKRSQKTHTVFLSNAPAPYRDKVYEQVARAFPDRFAMLFCMKREADRSWAHADLKFPQIFLKERVFSYHNKFKRFVHFNPDVWKRLNELNPDTVITNGYNPTHLIAFFWTKWKGRKHIAFYDGWLKFDNSLTFVHKWLRKIVIGSSAAFIGASEQTKRFFMHYGAPEEQIYYSYLCANNARFSSHDEQAPRKYDLMFSGRFIDIKMPLFFCEVARLVKEKRGKIKVLLLGNGPLEAETLAYLEENGIDYDAPGFVDQEDLPAYYFQSKLFLFPTQIDCWGVVANEACAAGLPVITCDNTAAAGELIQHGKNGFVLPLDAAVWADHCYQLLEDKKLYQEFAENGKEIVEKYSYHNAALGIIDAIQSLSQVERVAVEQVS